MPKEYAVTIKKLQIRTITVETDNPDEIGLEDFSDKTLSEAFFDDEWNLEIIKVEETE